MSKTFAYIRVSSRDQSENRQLDSLDGIKVDNIVIEKALFEVSYVYSWGYSSSLLSVWSCSEKCPFNITPIDNKREIIKT